MTQATITKKLNKTASEIQDLIRKSKRKLLELEVAMSLAEIKQGKVAIYKSADDFFKKRK